MVYRPSDLENVDSNTQVARIAHTVGENKRVLIVEEAKKKSIRILNPGLKKAPEPEVLPEPEPEAPTEPTSEPEEAAEPEKKAEKKTTAKKRKTRKSAK